MRDKFLTIALVVFYLAFSKMLLVLPARAQSETIQSAIQDIEASIDRLADIKVKKNTLNKIINLSLFEIENLRSKLNKFENLDEDYLKIHKSLLTKLEIAEHYLQSVKKRLRENITLEEIKQIANMLIDWREQDFNSTTKKVMDFVLVIQEKMILKTADNRYKHIYSDFKKIKDPETIKLLLPALKRADFILNESLKTWQEADGLLSTEFKDILSPAKNDAAVSENAALTNPPQEKSAEEAKTIQDLIESSFTKIKDAYKKFIEINKLLIKNT